MTLSVPPYATGGTLSKIGETCAIFILIVVIALIGNAFTQKTYHRTAFPVRYVLALRKKVRFHDAALTEKNCSANLDRMHMPFTPFHFGPGAALHSLAPKKISFLAFCAVNILVDLEPLYYMTTGHFPLHRFFHTYAGVSFLIAVAIAAFAGISRLERVISLSNIFRWKELTLKQVALGAMLGGYSHIVLDSVMHSDIRPLTPFSDGNALYHLVSLGSLHWFCVGSAALGIFVLGIRRAFYRSDFF